MCLGIPGKILQSFDANGLRMGRVEFGGIVRDACLAYTPEAMVGDYVVVHVGFAISRINAEEAARTYKLLEEMGQLSELEVGGTDGRQSSPQSAVGGKTDEIS
ncbi:MAG TPA: HypC/HybG/HupF family hydrogenase formation chaperone [Terriglobia bacterium]|nr:HypC/HybG/HupF family hydrogenase formation chaperone [Terriglobia bacterium]